jgi:hypothetical protein
MHVSLVVSFPPRRHRSCKSTLLARFLVWMGACIAVVSTTPALGAEAAHGVTPAARAAADGGVSSTEKERSQEAARAHFFRGVKYYEGGDLRWALLEFQRAYELSGNYRILYNLGRVNEELNTYAEATRAFEEYLRLGGDDIGAERREEVVRELETLRPKLARLTITVGVEGAEVVVDNRSMGLSPLGAAISVDGGEHFVVVRRTGYAQEEKRIVVAAGDAVDVAFELRRLDAGPRSAASSTARPRSRATSPPRSTSFTSASEGEGLTFAAKASWVGTGVLAAGAATAGVLAYTRAGDLARLRDSPDSTEQERETVARKARLLAITSDVLTGAAALAGATALYLTFGSDHRPAQRDRARVGVAGTQLTVEYHY